VSDLAYKLRSPPSFKIPFLISASRTRTRQTRRITTTAASCEVKGFRDPQNRTNYQSSQVFWFGLTRLRRTYLNSSTLGSQTAPLWNRLLLHTPPLGLPIVPITISIIFVIAAASSWPTLVVSRIRGPTYWPHAWSKKDSMNLAARCGPDLRGIQPLVNFAIAPIKACPADVSLTFCLSSTPTCYCICILRFDCLELTLAMMFQLFTSSLLITLLLTSICSVDGACLPCQRRYNYTWHPELGRRDVYSPKITSPKSDTQWKVGSQVTVTWCA
jgi:hypothetical protein